MLVPLTDKLLLRNTRHPRYTGTFHPVSDYPYSTPLTASTAYSLGKKWVVRMCSSTDVFWLAIRYTLGRNVRSD
jgi:hypothetical protein